MLGALVTAMLSLRFLESKIPYWQALLLVIFFSSLVDWWLLDLQVKKIPEAKENG